MKTILHPAQERGHANHGWLNRYHGFSYGIGETETIHVTATADAELLLIEIPMQFKA